MNSASISKKKPYFSVIIPTLNEAKYLSGLLTALKMQTCKDFEVIIVDARSKDATIKIARRFSTNFPLTIITTKEQNVGLQRNRGARYAKGYYLVFFDADTLVTDTYLAVLYNELQKSEVDFAATRAKVKSKHLVDIWLVQFVNLVFYCLFKIGLPHMVGTNMIFKKASFDEIGGFDDTIIHSEDLEIARRAGKQGYAGAYFMNICHYVSLRRWEREGRLVLWGKYILSFFYSFFGGKIKSPLFEYKMGGDV